MNKGGERIHSLIFTMTQASIFKQHINPCVKIYYYKK